LVNWRKSIFELSDIKILVYLHEKKVARYSELLDYLIKSRSTLANSLRQLQNSRLIDRKVKDTRPVQTEYVLTKSGMRLVQLLMEIKKLLRLS